ncbi:MAG: right-handed parallel beta-helix repeat-containing protein [Thiomargarita sp.]|nr:right-handed parallel beta-helix repeat-containing protein [Thiomargarita sp.]
MGTLLYAPPEQMGEERYGKPGAKSDFYAFGATLYRLMTNESPRTLNPRRLSDAPPELFDLLCHCKEENPRLRPEKAAEVVKRLETILTLAMTIVVSPTGNCQTISAAIKKAKTGDCILVKPGVYQEDLVIDKSLKIIGDGEVADIVVESQNANCIMMKTDKALVRGLSLHNRAENGYAVDMPQGQLTLEYCDITSDSLTCVGIHGSETEGIVSHCQIHDSKEGSGVYVYKNGTGQIENCDIFGNAYAGIEIKEGGNPVIQHCQIHDNQVGVYVWENGTGRIENCDIFGNALSGIQIREGGNPVIQKCTIKQNSYWAVFVYDGGAGTIENCDLRDNDKGAWDIESGCQVRRSGNKE